MCQPQRANSVSKAPLLLLYSYRISLSSGWNISSLAVFFPPIQSLQPFVECFSCVYIKGNQGSERARNP